MSSNIQDRPILQIKAMDNATQTPSMSPKFHQRDRSLSSMSNVSVASSAAGYSSNASTFQWRRLIRYWHPSSFRFQPASSRAFLIRWFSVALCLAATCIVWRLPPPSLLDVGFQMAQESSTYGPQVLRPLDSVGSGPTDPEKWLIDNTEEVLRSADRWWRRPPPKPRAAIISLVRNEELEGIMQSMRQLEYHWNRKYHYPWVFFNEKPFNDEFKVCGKSFLSGAC